MRKIETLRVLSNYGYCPVVSADELKNWKYEKAYPSNPEFRDWLYTDNQPELKERKQQTQKL